MGFMAMAVLAFLLTTGFAFGAESAPCSPETIEISIISAADLRNLTDALACEGEGHFNITWHSSLTVDEGFEVAGEKHMTVTGEALGDDNAAGVTIDAGDGTCIFVVSAGSTLRLNNIGIKGVDKEDGGAVAVLSSSALFVYGCTFTRNKAVKGGAIFASNSSIYIDGSTSFDENTALDGGAIFADSSDIGIDGTASFTSNSAGVNGGAVLAWDNSNIDIGGNAMFTNNSASGDGGAVWTFDSEVGIDGNATFTQNSAGKGGAVWAFNSEVGIDGNAMFTHNSALSEGGVVWTVDSEVGIDGIATFTQNSAGKLGGAVWAVNSEVGIDGNAMFTQNSAVEDGGAVWAFNSSVGIDGNAMFTHNSAYSDGGAVYASSSELGIDGNAMFTHNSAVVLGGAVFAQIVELGIDGSATFTHNSAGEDGGAVYADRSEFSIDGTAMFTHNSAGEDGGALRITYGSKTEIDGIALFTHNSALRNGGVMHVSNHSNIGIDGIAMFKNNSAGQNGGALSIFESSLNVTGSNARIDLSGIEGGFYSEAGGDDTSDWSVVFVSNHADELGGAIMFEMCVQVQVSVVLFKSNEATFGGAVYILAEDDKETSFSGCVLEGNTAADGGAMYLNTGPGVDIFNASVFRNNIAETSGGAIFHTGSMRVFNTWFVANMAGVEGPGVMSIGGLENLSNVSFVENTFNCRAGEYGYIYKNEPNFIQDSFCRSCLDQVCSRCSTVRDGASTREEVRIDGKPVCEKPPLGATAPSSGTTVANLTLEKGHFRTSNQSHVVLQCYRKSACLGGKEADKYCASGYTGPYCAVCAEDFAPGVAYSCRKCSGDITRSAVGIAVAVVLAVILLAGVLLSYLGRMVPDRAEDGIEIDQSPWKNNCKPRLAALANLLPVRAIKILVTVWQILSQFDAIAGDIYPDLYQTFVSKLNPINFDLDFVLSYSCLVSNDFYGHLVFATIMPLVALVVLAASYLIRQKRNICSESAKREVRHKHQAAVLFIAFFVYSPVSYRILQTFGCDELDDGTTYLRADYRLSCLTARHSWYKMYAFIMVAVYPIGITAAFAGLLVWHRRDLVKPDRGTMLHLKPLNGVWAAYKPSRYYYEVVECGRRIALTVIAAFILPNSTAQISIALLFAVVYVFISEVLSPFHKGIDMGLYRWGNGIIVASMYVAFLTKIDVGQDTASAGYILTYSGVLIAANLFMVVTVLIQTVLLAIEVRAKNNAVRVIEIPVRRTHSVSLRDLRPVNEGEVYWDRGEALESEDCES